jgi:hypothetical protein
MATVYDVYNCIVGHMCSHCNDTIRRKCNARDVDDRCKTKIRCIERILKPDYEEYPIKLPKV